MAPPAPDPDYPCILIFGTGSIGTLYAYILSRAIPESNIFAICRSNYDAATKNGFTINSTIWGNNLVVRPVICRSVDEAAKSLPPGITFDYVLVCAKALPTTPSIPKLLAPAMLYGNPAILLIQNGIGIEQIYADAYPACPILSCVVYLPATQTSPAVVSHKEVEILHLGTYPAERAARDDKDAAEHFALLMKKAGATAHVHDDVQGERWAKLLVNAAWNPVCALARSRDAEFLSSSSAGEAKVDDDALDYIRGLMTEISRVAQACGYHDVNSEKVEWQIGRARKRPVPGVEPSMMADAMAGREMEVDAILGNLVKIAKERKVDVPMLQGLFVLARALNRSFARQREIRT